MIRREFKIYFKSFLIWTCILIVMFLVVFLVYPYIITDETVESLDDMMKVFPPDLLKSFNMDISSINTAYGWLKSEGFMFVLLVIGIYSSLLGGNILLKEENDKTIEYLGVLPIKRNQILTNKIIVGIVYIVSIVFVVGLFNYIALLISQDFDHKQYLLLSITPLLVGIPLFAINLYISTFLHKTKKTIGIGLGLVFIFYLLNVLSELSSNVEFLKYFSIYTLADVRNVILDISINPLNVLISIIVTLVFIIGSYMRFNKKELL
ncbi:MAG: ABC transporter permease subunit [Bacilli bacterium]|nr:ABC transporter permease subunit [Bacilli bacterium]